MAGIGSRRPSSCQSLLTFREKANFRVGQNEQKNRVILQREGIRDGDNLPDRPNGLSEHLEGTRSSLSHLKYCSFFSPGCCYITVLVHGIWSPGDFVGPSLN